MADDIIQRLEKIEANMATKADLAELRAGLTGVATNVSVRHLGEQIRQLITESRATRADVRLLTSICNGIAMAVQGLVDHQIQLAERVATLETPPSQPE
jgi:hypothetical protein